MKLVEMLYNFVNNISIFLKKILTQNEKLALPEESEAGIEAKSVEMLENEITLAKRTLLNKLYELEQEIEVFKNDFKDKYNFYLEKINNLRKKYNDALDELNSEMTFEIDPEVSSEMTGEIFKLQKEIKFFIECDVKFNSLSKRLETLIVKLNILYNTSIKHPKEKSKVMAQVIRSLGLVTTLAQDFKKCDYILADNMLKDRIVTLISYADYQNFKIALRNSDLSPEKVFEKLSLSLVFKDFDYISSFKAFLEDEISDLGELTPLILEDEYKKIFEKKITFLLKEIAYGENLYQKFSESDFWTKVFELESTLLEFLKSWTGVEKEKLKVKIVNSVNICAKESEALTSPKSNTFMALTSLYSQTKDNKLLALLKLFKTVSTEISYKEIYFLLQLFDVIGIIQTVPNTLINHMEIYITKYPYDSETIKKKKRFVKNSLAPKNYIKLCALDEDELEVVKALNDLDFDFKITNADIYINSFYFNGLEEIFAQPNNNNLISEVTYE